MGGRAIRLYWFRPDDGSTNYGDALSPVLVEMVTGRPVVWAPEPAADLLGIGSILAGALRRRWRRPLHGRLSPIEVWGSGFIRPGRDYRSRLFRYRALRGAATRARVDAPDAPLGDPGLLAPRLIAGGPPPGKEHRWGIVPNMNDLADPAIRAMVAMTPGAVLIDLSGDVRAVTRRIASCEFILSTSLHGLVVADAFGAPTVWASVSDRVAGGDYKFLDYYSAYDSPAPERHRLESGIDLRSLEGRATARDPAKAAALAEGLARVLADF